MSITGTDIYHFGPVLCQLATSGNKLILNLDSRKRDDENLVIVFRKNAKCGIYCHFSLDFCLVMYYNYCINMTR